MENLKMKRYYKIFSVLILFIMFIIMCLYANSQSFWIDELDWTIDYLAKSNNIIDLFQNLLNKGFNLPLYYLAMFPIYKIVPYGEIWLLFPNFIAIIFGICIVGRIGKKVGGDELGFASLCIAATSFILIRQGAFEFRPYAFLFCFSAFTLYTYICRLQEPKSLKNKIFYIISLILLAYTHWYGDILIAFYFFVDVFLWVRKKISISFIVDYIILGITILPWLILLMINPMVGLTKYYAIAPTYRNFVGAFVFLLSTNYICMLLFFIGGLISLSYMIKKHKNRNIICILVGSILWVALITFIYSKYINPGNALFVKRHCFVFLPHILIITAMPISWILNMGNSTENQKIIIFKNIKINKSFIFPIVICIIILIGLIDYYKVHSTCTIYEEPYREGTEFFANTQDVYKDESAILTSSGRGYLTYYFEKQGKVLPKNVFEAYTEGSITQDNMTQCVVDGKQVDSIDITKEDLLKYDTIYLFEINKIFKEDILNFINENYKLVEKNEELGIFKYTK